MDRSHLVATLAVAGVSIVAPVRAAPLQDAAAGRETAIHESLVGVSLAISSEPIERGGGITLSSNPFSSSSATLNSVDSGSLTPPAEDHVYIIGHLIIEPRVDFELDHGDDWYLQAADGTKYVPSVKVLLMGWGSGGTEYFYAGSSPRRVDVFFEVPEPAAEGAVVVFFGKQFQLEHAEN